MTHRSPGQPDSYDDAYGKHSALFGSEPSPLLAAQWRRIPPGATVLDLGCGQGRNSFFLARKGFSVHALDPSPTATASVREVSETEALPIEPLSGSFSEHRADDGTYDAVLLFGIVQVLDRPQLAELARCIGRWLTPEGRLFVTAFTTLDPCMPAGIARAESIGPGSWRRSDGSVRTWLQPGELPALFPQLRVLHLQENLGPWHRHGDGELERHHVVAAVLENGGAEDGI